MLRRHDDAHMAANVGGAVLTRYRTLDIEHPALEEILTSGGFGETGFAHAQLIGCEVVRQSNEENQ